MKIESISETGKVVVSDVTGTLIFVLPKKDFEANLKRKIAQSKLIGVVSEEEDIDDKDARFALVGKTLNEQTGVFE